MSKLQYEIVLVIDSVSLSPLQSRQGQARSGRLEMRSSRNLTSVPRSGWLFNGVTDSRSVIHCDASACATRFRDLQIGSLRVAALAALSPDR